MKTSEQERTEVGPAGIAHSSFIGRAAEIDLLEQWLVEAEAGRGRVAMVAGEPGIGKTRLVEELAARARRRGSIVLQGACWEGEGGRAYGPFVEALDGYVIEAEPDVLRADVASYAGVLARLVPRLRTALPDLAEPVALQPGEERTRLFDAVSQLLIAFARRAPVTLLLDDLHWADDDTIAMLRHVARSVAQHRLLLVSAYRSGEVEESGALAEALAVLRRQTSFERLGLRGFDLAEVGALLRVLAAPRNRSAAADIEPALIHALLAETNGNPFFVRSVVLHLMEEGTLRADDGRWRATMPVAEIGLPEGVRQLLNRRLARLSPEARSWLTVGAAIGATFRFDVATAVAELDEARALAVVDEALAAQLIAGATPPDSYRFVHALVRQALCEALNPSRQVRLHRKIAEAMERVYGERASEHAVEIAAHYHRSRTLAGAERGVAHALLAADRAEHSIARSEVVKLLRMALDLTSENDTRRARILARFGVALAWCQRFDEAIEVAERASDLIAADDGDAAGDYLAEMIGILWKAGSKYGRRLLSKAKGFVGNRRDRAWVEIMVRDIVCREAEDPNGLGMPLDTPEREMVSAVIRALGLQDSLTFWWLGFDLPRSRAEASARLRQGSLVFRSIAGEYRTDLDWLEATASEKERSGALGEAGTYWVATARSHNALGSFLPARAALERAEAIAERLGTISSLTRDLSIIRYEMCRALDVGWHDLSAKSEAVVDDAIPDSPWVAAGFRSSLALTLARFGKTDRALALLGMNLPVLERAAGWTFGYPMIACEAAMTLWLLRRNDQLEVIEYCLRDKVLAPDFRWYMVDVRHSLACLCALREAYEEAADWFARARVVLDAQGARPLRAIADYDEALMYARRAAAGDGERAEPLLAAAVEQFRALGMPGWIGRAEELAGQLRRGAPRLSRLPTVPPACSAFVAEGEICTITHGEVTVRIKSSRGLSFLAELLRVPGQDVSAAELVARADRNGRQESARTAEQGAHTSVRAGLGDAGELLDDEARAAYKARLGELREELDEAERFNDTGRSERLREELEFLTSELSRAVGLGGRARVAGSHAERARVNVTRAISAALKKIAAQHPALGEHFARTIRTGTFCSYAPDPRAPIEWEV